MRPIQLHQRNAAKYLKKMLPDRRAQMIARLEEVAELEDIETHPAVKALSGNDAGVYRLRVGSYRALLRLIEDNQIEILFVDRIGSRGDVYKR
ncbi:MAG: type II toxin-antitoxin system RelE/ParE family toxin [Verrucomicrobiota bacterium]